MKTEATSTHSLKLSRLIKAPVERVYKAWTEPEQMKQWFGCAETCEVEIEQDLRQGGDFRIKMHLSNGDISEVHGTFKEVLLNERLVFTWTNNFLVFPARDTLVEVVFLPRGEETEVRLTHTKFATEHSAQGHTVGWGAAMDKFVGLFEISSTK